MKKNSVKLLLDLEYVNKLQKEFPSKLTVMFASAMQFLIGSGILSFVIKNSNTMSLEYIIFPLVVLAIFLILFSAYTFFGYLIRKRYILLIEALVQNDDELGESA